MSAPKSMTERLLYVFSSPDRGRLAGAVLAAWADFDTLVHRAGHDTLTDPWARSAFRFLLQADSYLANGDLQQGWIALLSAQRAMLGGGSRDADRILRAAVGLRREMVKITGWRAKAIEDLICGPDGELKPNIQNEPDRVIEALALRDDQFHTTYFKILLRRRHLLQLFLVLGIGILLCVVLSLLNVLPGPFANHQNVIAAILFGALGAALSVSRGLLSTDVSAKIPAQQVGAFVVWMRPMIGATAALIALVLLYANDAFKFFAWDTAHPGVIIAVSFAAGFSERFIVGAIERIAPKSDT
jgi:hypothetical protein